MTPKPLIFIKKIPVVENNPTTGQIIFTMAQVDTDGKHCLFLHEQLFTFWKYTDKASNKTFNEDIMENN